MFVIEIVGIKFNTRHFSQPGCDAKVSEFFLINNYKCIHDFSLFSRFKSDAITSDLSNFSPKVSTANVHSNQSLATHTKTSRKDAVPDATAMVISAFALASTAAQATGQFSTRDITTQIQSRLI